MQKIGVQMLAEVGQKHTRRRVKIVQYQQSQTFAFRRDLISQSTVEFAEKQHVVCSGILTEIV